MIHYVTPWNTKKILGKAYNATMNLVDNNDWVCFTDGDSMFTTNFFGKQIEDIIAKYPECGCFTAMANRIGCLWQRSGNWDTDDMRYHRFRGQELYDQFYDDIIDVTHSPRMEVMGGVLILIKKNVWSKVGGFREKGILGIDNDLHWKIQRHKEKVYLMKGVYLYHWYRGGSGDKSHLI